jgi:hypothetical protein
MEDSVIFYLLDVESDWNSWSDNLQESLAVQTLQEWICSDKFKIKASFYEVELETTLGRRLLRHQAEDQYWKDSDYQKVKSLLEGVYEYWYKRQWACVETTKNGRPRKSEYSTQTISKAMKYAHVPFFVNDGDEEVMYKSIAWSKSVLGETNVKCWVGLITVKENVFKHLFNICGVEYFSGCTKVELMEKLKLPKKFVNEMCRWLISSGNWIIVQAKKDGQRRREMRYSVI